MTSRKRLSPEESRNSALEAARALLIETGPQSVTLKAVAARIGRTHANLLHHFGSASGLQKALAEHLARTDTPTGHANITVAPDGENAIVILAGANAAQDIGRVRAALEAPDDLLQRAGDRLGEGHRQPERERAAEGIAVPGCVLCGRVPRRTPERDLDHPLPGEQFGEPGRGVTGRAAQLDLVALVEHPVAHGHRARLVVDAQRAGAGDAGHAHAAGDHGRVAGHAAAGGQDALGDGHAADVLGAGLGADEKHRAALGRHLLRPLGGEGDHAGGRSGAGRQTVGLPEHRQPAPCQHPGGQRVPAVVEVERAAETAGARIGAAADPDAAAARLAGDPGHVDVLGPVVLEFAVAPAPASVSGLEDPVVEVVEVVLPDEGADLGVAFDGDGDRLGVVDNAGKLIWPDRVLMLLAGDVLGRHPGVDILYDVKSSRHLASFVLSHGGRPIMWQSGHSRMRSKMLETGALLGGEFSGHLFIKERWYGFDDAIYAATRVLEIVAIDPRPASELFAELPSSPATPEYQLMLEEGQSDELMRALDAHKVFDDARLVELDGLRVEFASGWGLIRASNTMPALTFRFEADDPGALEQIKERFRDLLRRVAPDLRAPF